MKLLTFFLALVIATGSIAAQNAQPGGKPKPLPDSIDIEKARKESPRIKADTKGNIEKITPKKEASTANSAVAAPTATKVSVFNAAGKDTITTPSGLKYIDIVVGRGEMADSGKMVEVHYTGWLSDSGKRGKMFQSSVEHNAPLAFLMGRKLVIAGWEEGIEGMKVGGKRTLIIKRELGFGATGFRDLVPPNSDLIFDIELLAIKKL